MESSQHPGDLGGKAAVFDQAASLEQIGGDADLLEALIAAHLDQEPQLLRQLTDAVVHRDALAIRKAAHALASSVSVLCAPRARKSAKHAEGLGLRGELAEIENAQQLVQEEFRLLRDALQAKGRSRAA